jgi:hypothetical protein
MKFTPRERFLAKVCPESSSGCWLWRGQVRADGYGLVRFERKVHLAHRLAWKFFRGEIAPGLVVCHKCDVRGCVNPEHLFLGTMMDNVKDMMEKGRSLHGEKHRSAKLTAEQVRRIKTMLAEDLLRVSDIAREYGVTHRTIACIARGTSWRHVKLPTAAIQSGAVEQPKQESVSSVTIPEDEL